MPKASYHIASALAAASDSDVFARIYPIISTSGGYYDALIIWDPETGSITVEQIPSGSRLHPEDHRFAIHREPGLSCLDSGLENSDLFSDTEIAQIHADFDDDRLAFCASARNDGGTWEDRCEEAHRYYFCQCGGWDRIVASVPSTIRAEELRRLQDVPGTLSEKFDAARIDKLHAEAMELVGKAMFLKDQDPSTYKKIMGDAFKIEKQAADLVYPKTEAEPGRSIIYQSAAHIAYDIERYEEAKDMIYSALSGTPPLRIATELNNLLESIQFCRPRIVHHVRRPAAAPVRSSIGAGANSPMSSEN